MAASSCNICEIFSAYQAHADTTLGSLVNAVHGPFEAIILSLVGGWILWAGMQVFLGTLDFAGALKQAIFMVLGFGVYKGVDGGLISDVFDACVNVMGGLSSTMMDGGGAGLSGLDALLLAVETGIGGVFNIATTIMGSGSWGKQIVNTFYGVALLLPYVILLVLFLAHTSVSLFRLTLILGVSPFLIGMAAFPFGRNLIGAGVRTIIGSIVTMLCVTMVFSLVIASVKGLGVTADAEVDAETYIDLTSGKFLLAMIMGWLGAALISEAVNIAGQVSSSVLGTVSAGIMSAGAMRGAASGASMATAGARGAAPHAADMAGKAFSGTRSKRFLRPGGIIDSGSS